MRGCDAREGADEILRQHDTEAIVKLVMRLTEGILSKKRLRERVEEHRHRAKMRHEGLWRAPKAGDEDDGREGV